MDYIAKPVSNTDEAQKVSEFIRQTFDDSNFTKGEYIQIQELPLCSIGSTNAFFWFVENQENEIIGVAGVHENLLLSGGYEGDYLAIRRDWRGRRLADFLVKKMLTTAKENNGRYLLITTGEQPDYKSAIQLFIRNGFEYLCTIQHYYFQNEGAVLVIKYL